MRALHIRLGFLTAAAAGMVGSISIAAAQSPANQRGEAKLAKTLEGRVPGKPVDCIQLHDIRSSRIIDGTAILYDTGNKLYLNRPSSGASSLDDNDVLVTDTHSPQLCSVDVVHLYDNASHMPDGFVGLGKFVPYTKPPKP